MTPDKSPVEPAHPMMIDLHDSLVAIYTVIRDKYQEKIDAAFDDVSRQIGFVVTTTIPVEVEVAGGKIKSVSAAAENLKGTLFEKIASTIGSDALPKKVAANKYRLYLIWYKALKLRLRTDFMEPAHFRSGVREPAHFQWGVQEPAHFRTGIQEPAHFRTGIQEPAHWFDPGFAIAGEEAVVIHAIDDVYPELKLAERVSAQRQLARGFGPGVREPAHFRPEVREPAHLRPEVREPAHPRPEVLEPVHPSPVRPEFLAELQALLKKHGL